MQPRQLGPDDATAYQALRLRALRESPAAFCASHADEAGRSVDEVAERLTPSADSTPATFGVFDGGRLLGFVAVLRPARAKLRHTAELAGMYVAPEARRRGVARALLRTAIDHALALNGVRQIRLGVNADNAAARALYESHGFVCYGVEPDSMHVDGVYHDQALYMLRRGAT